ncbi:hypothetical protein [Streptomyces murinus]|uniref:Uncharacterized protein n=1 Tax=Streptomyces murinus TaxID=33900 RepID=A0A7W3NKF6_STRMR|nr:hypothetical protein [Streptomyces murinus]MBA9052159.1 hypothetical protein [Streptomyces murinus]UWW93420.1 hypothetical protein GO605_23315 [Streptomyces murinus]
MLPGTAVEVSFHSPITSARSAGSTISVAATVRLGSTRTASSRRSSQPMIRSAVGWSNRSGR